MSWGLLHCSPLKAAGNGEVLTYRGPTEAITKQMSSQRTPQRYRLILESRMEGRTHLIAILLEHRRAVERMAVEQSILSGDRSAILACATFAYTELLGEAGKQQS